MLFRVVNGQRLPMTDSWVDTAGDSTARHVHVKVDGNNLGVWVDDGGTWLEVFDPADSGQGLLTHIADGAVGLASHSYDTLTCSQLRIGTDSGDHVLADAETAVAETFATSVAPMYDAAGNMTYDGQYHYAYDAWNRLVAVQRPGAGASPTPQPIGQYRYDGLGRRIYKAVTNSGQRDGTEHHYYANWQLLEVRRNVTGSETDRASHQFVWGSQYIDEAICLDVDTDADGDCTDLTDTGTNPAGGARRFFYCQDANYNVAALREGGTIVERYEYDPYGTVRIYKGWSSAAGCELQQVTGRSLKWLDPGLPENPVLYCGYFRDGETRLYHVRYRMLGRDRWIQRDPLVYIGDPNAYSYVRNNPTRLLDPWGLLECNKDKEGARRGVAGATKFSPGNNSPDSVERMLDFMTLLLVIKDVQGCTSLGDLLLQATPDPPWGVEIAAALQQLGNFDTLLKMCGGFASVWTKVQCQQCECTNHFTGWPFYRAKKDFAWVNSGKKKWVQCDLSNTDWGRNNQELDLTAYHDSDVLLFRLLHPDDVEGLKDQCAEQAEKSCEE